MTLIINEIFHSIQGESIFAGLPSVFIRLTKCNLKCSYCDTNHARSKGKAITVNKIIDIIAKINFHHVTVTGGEPLLQENTIPFLHRLIDYGYITQLETNGSLTLKDVPKGVRKIVDIKTPSSGEEQSFEMDNLFYITKNDEIKFVVADINDYNFALEFVKFYLAKSEATVNISPVHGVISPAILADLILKSQQKFRLNIQLHKTLWGDKEKDHYIDIPLKNV